MSMTWVTYSLLMFFSSVALYLSVRKSSLVKVPLSLTNLAMFAIPLVATAAVAAVGEHDFSLSAWHFAVLAVTAIVFAYGGNTVSLKAIEIAPNPGYSLVLSKSYVLFTTIVAVVLLNADLTLQNAIAILAIVGFSALIMINRKQAKATRNNKWVWLSLSAFFAWGFLSLFSKYLFSQGVGTIPFLVFVYALVTLCIVVFSKVRFRTFQGLSSGQWLLLVTTGLSSALFNLGQFEAINLAPNVGYVNAINAGSISLVTLLAVLLFKDELSAKKAIGILGVTAGLLVLFL